MSEPKPKHASSAAKMEEELEGECEVWSFMKGGECRGAYMDWKQCDVMNEVLEKRLNVTLSLIECMQAHSDYYDNLTLVIESRKKALEQLNC